MSDAADRQWRELGLAAPARRALIAAGIMKPQDLKGWTVAELADLHGIGKNALATLAPWLKKGT